MSKDLVFRSNLLSQVTTPPTRVGRATARQLQRMENIVTATTEALDQQSEITEYAMFKALTTMRSASVMQTMANAYRIPLDVQAAQRHLAMDYLYAVSRTTEIANDEVIATLSRICSREERESFWDRLRDFFS